jgi:hypothetical protein
MTRAGTVGRRGDDGQFSFVCERCGNVAARLLVSDGKADVDAGPVPGGKRLVWTADGERAVRFEFLGITTGAASQALQDLVEGKDFLDAVDLRAVEWDLATFLCRACERVYCRECWSTRVEFDDGFYDCTMGSCPEGHSQMLDD